MIKPIAFSHAFLPITDLDRARDFYEGILGLTPMPRPNFGVEGVWYSIGKNQIHLAPTKLSGRHFAIEVEDYDAACAELRENDVRFNEAPMMTGGRQLALRDPDGNGIELRSGQPQVDAPAPAPRPRVLPTQPDSLNHTAVRISDLDRSRKFYEGMLGLNTIPRPNLGIGGVWYGIGSNQIHLIAVEQQRTGIDPTGPHIALELKNFDATRDAVKERGMNLLEFPGMSMPGLGRQFWILDPDGNTIELRTEK